MANTNVPTADLAAADAAATEAKDSGAGDMAVYDARKAELERIRDRSLSLAKIRRQTADAEAEIWGGARGAKIVETAERVYREACSEATRNFHESLALFAVRENFVTMLPVDQQASVAARALATHIRPMVTILSNLSNNGVETVDTGDGKVLNVVSFLATLQDIGNFAG